MAASAVPVMNSLESHTAVPLWIREKSQATLNSVEYLITDIESCPLKSWSFIWTATVLFIVCISDTRSSSDLCDL